MNPLGETSAALAGRVCLAVAAIGLAVPVPAAESRPFPRNSTWQNDDRSGYFATPSGRIVCGYEAHGKHSVFCTNFQTGTTGGQLGQKTWFVTSTSSWLEVLVANAPTEDLPRAKYRVTYRYHGLTCRIRRTRGIRCKNRADHGFRVSVQSQKVF